ncbi:MAG: cytochrome b/b6 [Alphaproteobacteria bacterium]|nr:cytochrome b/b6 [Alphaproteobacteria bacterium]MBU1526292.1 cytochrome b/b6 [Alphaproteobacteria bacterium]MBU2116096.1 cytochrome b/b6 [Alphaproteobacteria bacterium]MBU2351449.1 cytochrome b/b6 [Alphaproteobacteria bacterium]MBU2382796.1 cytochrome b/b6 [Alphaproteobacteria bacterium]
MSEHESTYVPKTGIEKWLDARLPVIRFGADYMSLPTPRNLNYWWTFGAILMVCLMVQIITGVVLAMHYTPNVEMAFASVERIMRDVPGGWLIRYVHANGASMFFIAVYIHMLRGLYYGSYKAPREIIWILGCLIFFLMIATAFLGYVLPWGQMSFWGAEVITNLIGAIPIIGEPVLIWLRGGPAIDNATLNRFFSLHYLLPFVILGVVVLHLWALHTAGQNNPVGVLIPKDRTAKDTLPFHPYYTVKDGVALILFMMMFAFFVFFMPNALGHADNYIPANPLQTPAHIVPEWYMLPFYAILRAIPDKFGGVVAMFAAIGILFVLPWLDTSKVRSMRYRPTMKVFFILFVLGGMGLGWCGAQLPDAPVIGTFKTFVLIDGDLNTYLWLTRLLTLYYFAFFLVIMPIVGLRETPLPVPASVSEPVLSGGATPAAAMAQAEKKG